MPARSARFDTKPHKENHESSAPGQRLINKATSALIAQITATMGKTSAVFPDVSRMRPMSGSARPANRSEEKFMMPVAVPARREPTRSGPKAQNDDAGPYTKNPQRNRAATPMTEWPGIVNIHMLVAAPNTIYSMIALYRFEPNNLPEIRPVLKAQMAIPTGSATLIHFGLMNASGALTQFDPKKWSGTQTIKPYRASFLKTTTN